MFFPCINTKQYTSILSHSNNMALNLYYLQNFLILFIFIGNAYTQSPCEDWEPYRDEKCIKIFNSPGVLGYADAETYCSTQSANLMSIRTRDKQDFIEKFLISSSVTDNVWLGLKYSDDNGYEWSDGTPFHFANWAAGSPKNDSSYCIEIHTEEEDYGKWSEVACSRKNLIVCEKLQLWSYSKLQTALMNVMMNPVPMGFIYVQLPEEKLPSDVWPLLGWEDVTSKYAGVFFRAEGGNSSPFGEIQEENSPRLINVKYNSHVSYGFDLNIDFEADQSNTIRTGVFDVKNYNSETGLNFTMSSGEVRPRNMAIRIWKRVE